MLIPTRLEGLEISINDFSEKQSFLINEYGFDLKHSYHIFMLKNAKGKTFFVNAAAFYVFHNKQITPCESGLKDDRGGYPGAFGEDVMSFPPERKSL